VAIHLSLLGHVGLVHPDGAAIEVVLAQPKRLALLAYLVADRPVRLHRRDALLLMFWPDATEERARGALSQSLSFLRRALGPDAIVSRGAEEVGVDPARITSDVEQFERAAGAGEHAAALARYQGDFLAAFHVDGCNDFDDWAAAERARLRELAVRSAKAVSRLANAAGDGSAAVVAARHALLLAPFDESAARQVLTVLRDAGRPALAVAEFDAFRARLRTELGVEPSPGLRQLVEEIRAGG
jgi:DNA-binding SARP family transcriptional activator